MREKNHRKGLQPLHFCLLAALLAITVKIYAQFGGFGFPPAPDGMGMPGMPGMGNMFPTIKHTKVD